MTILFVLNFLAKAIEARGFAVDSFDAATRSLVVSGPDSDFLGTLRVTADFDFEGHPLVFQVSRGGRVPSVAHDFEGAAAAVVARFEALGHEWM
jgi:hypothetical protein